MKTSAREKITKWSQASDEALDALAKEYAKDAVHGVDDRDALPKARLARALMRTLPSIRDIRSWNLVEDVLEHLSPEERVSVMVRYDRKDRRGKVLPLLERLDEDPRELLRAELEELRAHPDRVAPRGNAAYLLAQLHVAAGESVPEELDEDLRYFSVLESDSALDERLFRALPKARAAAIAGGSVWGNRALLGLIDDEGLYDQAVRALEDAGGNDIARALGGAGERVLGALERGAEGDAPVARLTGIAQALGLIRAPASADLLRKLLGHSSKTVRAAARQSLGELGEVARAAIEAGTEAKKKAVREACRELLEILGAQEAAAGSPLERLEEEAEALDEATRAAILAWPSTNPNEMDLHVRRMTDAHGPVVLVVLRDWFLEGFPRQTSKYLAAIGQLSGRGPDVANPVARPEQALAAAYVALDAIARAPKPKGHQLSDLRKSLPATFGAWAAEAAASALRTRKTPLAEIFYGIAAQDPAGSRDVLVGGLSESGKGIRATCVEALATLGEVAVDDVLPLLSARKASTREAAARVLAAVGSAKATGRLAEALDEESSDDVRMTLEDALRASGGGSATASSAGGDTAPADTAPADTGPADTGPGDTAQGATVWEAQLAVAAKPRLPAWVDAEALPPLTFVTGETLSDEGRAALIGRLKKEHERPDGLVADVVQHLDPASAAAFGEALFQQWEAAGAKARDKWALYQLGQVASDDWIHGTAPALAVMSDRGRHAQAGWHLDVYARLGTTAALDWIAFWADHAVTAGLRKKAMEQLGELAAARGVSEQELRAQRDPFVNDVQAERRAPDLGFDARGAQRVSLGAREMTLRIGPDGALRVLDEAGEALAGMPAAGPDDDAAAMKAAERTFQRLEKEVDRTLKSLSPRLERAMIGRRTWTRARFDAVFLSHPILGALGTRVVFATADGKTFRISEEGAPIDATGAEVTLGDADVLHIVHPLELDEARLAAWREHLQRAGVVPPFTQIDRPTFTWTKGQKLSGPPIPPRTFKARAREAGWKRGPTEDAGLVFFDWIPMPSHGVMVRLHHSGYAASGDWDEPVTDPSLEFVTPSGDGGVNARTLDPIAYSEAWYAAQRVLGGVAPKAAPKPPKPETGGGAQKALPEMSAGFPSADHAPSGRAKCMHCNQKIEKGSVRLVVEREISTPRFEGKGPGYMHGPCAIAWAEANGVDEDDFVRKVRAHTALAQAELPAPFGE